MRETIVPNANLWYAFDGFYDLSHSETAVTVVRDEGKYVGFI